MAITNSTSAAPSMSTFPYNTWEPGQSGFPENLGDSYVDPVFSTTIHRMTVTATTTANFNQQYSFHSLNADATLYFDASDETLKARYTSSFGIAYNSLNAGTNGYAIPEYRWHMTDPDVYFYLSGSNLIKHTLSTGATTVAFAGGGTLQSLGASTNYADRTNRYYILKWGGTAKVCDLQTGSTYANPVTPLDTDGWVTITPDAKYVITAAGATAQPDQEHYSYEIVHGTNTVSTTAVQFWGLCGDHGGIVSASDGKSYFVTFNCYDGGFDTPVTYGIYAVDVSLNQSGRTSAQQKADALFLLPTDTNDGFHASGISLGDYKDWCFISLESTTDDFDGGVSGWYAFRSEIFAVHVTSGAWRRLAHHRSRDVENNYSAQPKVSCAPDGSYVMWMSNQNSNGTADYADHYGIENPFNASEASTTTPAKGITTIRYFR